MTELTNVFGLNKFCGPGVLSAFTGMSTDECARVIGQISGQRQITGVQYAHLLEVCRRLGFTTTEIPVFSRTLFGCLLNLSKNDGKYIIVVPNHYVAVEVNQHQVYLIDNHTKRPINAAASARLSQTVQKIWRVVGKTPDELMKERIEARKKYIGEQLEILNREIENRTRIRFELEMELNNLERGGLI